MIAWWGSFFLVLLSALSAASVLATVARWLHRRRWLLAQARRHGAPIRWWFSERAIRLHTGRALLRLPDDF